MAEIYSFEIAAEVQKARRAVDAFAKDTQKQLDSLNFNTTISAIADAFRIGADAIRPVVDVLKKAVAEAIEAEQATASLANSMRLVGDFSDEALQNLTEYADNLARTTTLTDDQVLAGLALSKSFRLTNEEAKQVIGAAKELSAITGADLASSVEKLAKTYNGFIDKSLKQLIPELKALTEEQLATGEAVRIVAERFNGSAAAAANTFGGSVSQLSKSIGELLEALGNVVVKSDGAKSALQSVTEEINSLAAVISSGKLSQIFFDIKVGETFGDVKKRLDELEEGAQDFEAAMKNAMRSASVKGQAESQIKAQREADNARIKALEEFNAIRADLEKAGLTDIEKINKEAADQIKIVRAAINTGAIENTRQAQEFIANLEIGRARKVAEETKKLTEKAIAEEKKAREEAFSRTKSIASLSFSGDIGNISGIKDLAAAGAGFVSNVVKGAAGAQKLVSSAIGAAADMVIPGIGGAVSEIVNVLAQGPEQTKKMVEEFTDALPKMVENLADSLPILIQALAEKLPPALAKAMPTVAFGFSLGLVKNMPLIVKGFAQGLIDAVKQAGQAFIDMIKDLPSELFGGISGSGNGGVFDGIPVLGGIGDFFGFAEGGRVPDQARYMGDRFPARLNAGEQVLDRDLSGDLERFLQGEGGGGGGPRTVTINVQVGMRQLASVLLDAQELGFRTGAARG